MLLNFLVKNPLLMDAFQVGLEKESLRITKEGNLSTARHPPLLGSPLTHPFICTDFSEQQIEWNTSPHPSLKKIYQDLKSLIHFSLINNPDEYFWPFSMPPPLAHIEIAKYGTSYSAVHKHQYREGLISRYGASLQMISGIHFNYSLDRIFWNTYHSYLRSTLPIQEFINIHYLHISRNFLREGWLITYLFGSSPHADPTFYPNKHHASFPFATSIRTSNHGYYSRIQNQLLIPFDSLESYVNTLQYATTTPHPDYLHITKQLNPYILQTDNEYYSRIRPKATPKNNLSSLQCLSKTGIEYLEIRSIDNDPFEPVGISIDRLQFLHCFLLYCLHKPSPLLTLSDQHDLTYNQNLVALRGREPNLTLRSNPSHTLKTWALFIMNDLTPIAQQLGIGNIITKYKTWITTPALTPSAQIMTALDTESFHRLGTRLARDHAHTLSQGKISKNTYKRLVSTTQQSQTDNRRLETASKILTTGYEDLELSTQILIKKALEWNLNINILDRHSNIISIQQDDHIEYIQQATKTSADTYITPNLMDHKHVTKQILTHHGFQVPQGSLYTDFKTAYKNLSNHLKVPCVIKPELSNYGIGIHMIEAHNIETGEKALREAFSHSHGVIIEHFFSGKEYRFLIINHQCVGICHRVPANITGNGKDSIKTLVKNKNTDSNYYRAPKTFITLGQHEKQHLQAQGLSPTSILKENQQVFLRNNSNVSTGGDPIEMEHHNFHPGYIEIAIAATKTLNAAVCGVDIMIQAPKKPPADSTYTIIEMNYNPVLFIHANPYQGKAKDVGTPILQLLNFHSGYYK